MKLCKIFWFFCKPQRLLNKANNILDKKGTKVEMALGHSAQNTGNDRSFVSQLIFWRKYLPVFRSPKTSRRRSESFSQEQQPMVPRDPKLDMYFDNVFCLDLNFGFYFLVLCVVRQSQKHNIFVFCLQSYENTKDFRSNLKPRHERQKGH